MPTTIYMCATPRTLFSYIHADFPGDTIRTGTPRKTSMNVFICEGGYAAHLRQRKRGSIVELRDGPPGSVVHPPRVPFGDVILMAQARFGAICSLVPRNREAITQALGEDMADLVERAPGYAVLYVGEIDELRDTQTFNRILPFPRCEGIEFVEDDVYRSLMQGLPSPKTLARAMEG